MENVAPNNLQRLRAADIIRMAGLTAASVGQEYYRSGAVHSLSRQGALLLGVVELPSKTGSVKTGSVGVGLAPTQGELAPTPAHQANDNTFPRIGLQHFPVEIEFLEAGASPARSLQASAPFWRCKCSCRSDAQLQGNVAAGPVSVSSPTPSLLCAHGAALLYQWLAQPSLFQTQDVTSATGVEQGQAKSETYGMQVTHKNARSDITTGGRKEALGVGMRASSKPGSAPPVSTEEQMESPIQRYSVELAPTESLLTLLTQLSLSDLRSTAREYGLVVSGMARQQLAESILAQLKKPDVVRRVAGTLEKSQRQLLAALVLAGGVMSDDDLRGLFERFSLGHPSQLQSVLLTLQSKVLLFRISLNASNIAQRSHHGLLNSALLDIGWYVPWEVWSALRVSVPVTPFDVTSLGERSTGGASRQSTIELAEPSSLLSTLLLLSRFLDGYTPDAHETWYDRDEQRGSSEVNRGKSASIPASGLLSTDGSIAMPSPEDLPSHTLLQELQERLLWREWMTPASQLSLPSQSAFLRFAIRVLGVADLLHQENGPALSLRPATAERLLGSNWTKTLRTLFKRWLMLASYGDLYDLNEENIRLRCRATSLHQPILRTSELEAENSQARQHIAALLAQTPLNQWINFSAFVRFVYRLNPLFLQREQQWGRATIGSLAPQWWLELDEGRPLRPTLLNDWLRAEHFYLRHMIAGPFHWWGACDIATSADGYLLAFRLTPIANWLFNGIPVQEPTNPLQLEETDDYQEYVAALDVTVGVGLAPTLPLLLISCSVRNWPVIQLLEQFMEETGIQQGRLAYRISAQTFGLALGRGLRPFVLLRLLHLAIEMHADLDKTRAELFTQIVTQLEQWLTGYSRVRLYTGVTLLETVDMAVMREVVATTSLEESIVQNIHPTLCIVKPDTIGHIVEELKQRGQSPLLHDEDL